MSNPNAKTRVLALTLTVGGTLAMTGCVTAPTYGTGTRSDVQLMEDVSNIVSLRPPKRQNVAYNPRPTLVKPAEMGVLPPPQADVADDNPNWPESPEQRRARIRAEADANADNPNFRPEISADPAVTKRPRSFTADRKGDRERYETAPSNITQLGNPLKVTASKAKKRESVNDRIAGEPDITTRRYLSDPPVKYQKSAETAPVNDVGEKEYDKEKRRKALIKKGDKKGWRDYLPF